jgi:hypothetical protein
VDLTTTLQLITTLSALLAAAALIALAYEVSQIRHGVTRISKGHHASSQDVGPYGSPCGYAIYVFRNNRWELESDLSAPGFEPSAPSIPGAFEGHVVKKESRPSG